MTFQLTTTGNDQSATGRYVPHSTTRTECRTENQKQRERDYNKTAPNSVVMMTADWGSLLASRPPGSRFHRPATSRR